MSCNYAEGLSPYHDKGQLGLEEKFDSKSVVSAKVSLLTKWINEAKHVVIHTGAGISTSAGIPDFRGPKGVWTLEAKGEKPDLNKDFNEAIPTITHMAIMKLVEKKKVNYVVSQNIDGLHLRSNLQRKFLSELHGNMFTEQCSSCNRQFVRSAPVPSVGQKTLNKPCPTLKANGRPCRGRLHDTILDWEHNLPENDLGMADYHSCLADLSICLGTTMQIVPSGNLPLYTKKHGGKLVIVNLQPTKHDKKADLLIHAYVDEVMTMLMKNLNIKIPKYSPKNDPSRTLSSLSEKFLEWTISDYTLKKMKKVYEEKCGTKEAKKRLEMIDDDLPLSLKTFKRKAKDEEDSDLEVVDVIVKSKRGRESSKRGLKKNSTPVYNTTITIKKVTPPPLKKGKFEGAEKITIKKNVTPTKTKYEIVTKPKKTLKCEIVYNTETDLCNDLDMVCESDDDEMTNNFTYNFKRYLHDDIKKEDTTETKTFKKGEKNEIQQIKMEINDEIKVEEEENGKKEMNAKKEIEIQKISLDDEAKVSPEEKCQLDAEISNKEEKVEIIGGKNASEKIDKKSIPSSDNNDKYMLVKPVVKDIEYCMTNSKENIKEKEHKKTEKNGKEIFNEENKNSKKTVFVENSVTETVISGIQKRTVEVNLEKVGKTDIEQIFFEKNLVEFTKKKEHEEISKDEKVKNKCLDKDKENGNGKKENIEKNIESELPSLSSSNIESQINQVVDQTESSHFDNSVAISNCNINSSVNENYEFYSNTYNSSNNSTDLDYVDNNYYNNF